MSDHKNHTELVPGCSECGDELLITTFVGDSADDAADDVSDTANPSD